MRSKLLILGVLLLFFPHSAWAAPPGAEPVVHTVRWGETIYSIAQRYGTSIAAIARANGLANPSWVYAGQRLTIPTEATSTPQSPTIYIVRWGDTLYSIARSHGTTPQALVTINRLQNPNFIWVGQRLVLSSAYPSPRPEPVTSFQIHVVRRGETLLQIARGYHITAGAIASANNLINPSFIYVGQRLIIPEAGNPGPSSEAPPEQRWIDINLSTQRLVAYEGDEPVYSAIVSTGTPNRPTVTGRYRIQRKYWYDDMSYPGYYYLPDVPYVMYFYGGYAVHGTYWHNNFGTPMSFGCVNLTVSDAEWLFNWTTPTLPSGWNVVYASASDPGTLVVIHY